MLFSKRISPAVTTALTLTLFILLFSSCGKKPDEKAAAPQAEESKTEKVELIFWHGIEGKHKNDLIKQKIADFNQNSSFAHIVLQNYGAADQLSAKLMTAVAGDSKPDLLWWAPQQFGLLVESDLLTPFDDLIAGDKTFQQDDIFPGLWEASTINGKIYSIPFETNNLAVYYNRDLFEKAGIKEPPKTWDELAEAAQKLTADLDGDGKTDRYGLQLPLGKNEWTVWTWQTFLWQAGGEFYDPAAKKVVFNTKAGAVALDFWINLIDKGVASFSEPEAGYKIGDFLAGRVAMMINGPWNLGELQAQSQIQNYGSFPLPKNKTAATNIGGEHIALLSDSPKKAKAAWEFVKYLVSPEFQVDWSIKTGYIPISSQAIESKEYQDFLQKNPFMSTFANQMKVGRARPAIAKYTRYSSILGRALEKALYKKTTPPKALDQAAAECAKVK